MMALLTSNTIVEASQKAGISKATGFNYLKDIKFKRYYRKYRTDLMQQTTAHLQAASIEAVNVLRGFMNDPDISPYARQQSAQTILSMAYKAHETTDIIEMVEELEAKFNNE